MYLNAEQQGSADLWNHHAAAVLPIDGASEEIYNDRTDIILSNFFSIRSPHSVLFSSTVRSKNASAIRTETHKSSVTAPVTADTEGGHHGADEEHQEADEEEEDIGT
jgi:hypothetical protein